MLRNLPLTFPSPDVCLHITARTVRLTTIDHVPTEPILSVVLPVRNVAVYLPDMIASLRRNTHPDFEFVIVDDGSDDATPQVIDTAREVLPRLRTIRHDVAVGLGDARNAGVTAAAGRYVTFLDGDDWIAPGYLADLVSAIERLGCDFVRVDHVQVHARKRVVHRAPEARRDQVLEPRSGILPAHRRTMVDYPYAWAGIYHRDLGELLHFPGHLHTAEDRPWIWRLHREARSYAVVSLAGLFYRRMITTSLTQIGDERQLNYLDAFALVFAQVADEPALQVKAIRQFLAVQAHHIRTQERFARPVRRAMHQRAKELIATLPPRPLRETLPTDARRQLLRPLLPPAVRRTVPVELRAALDATVGRAS